MLRIILGVLLAVTLAVLLTLNVVNVVQVKGVEKGTGEAQTNRVNFNNHKK